MTEWGTPDWRDASAYGDVHLWDLDRWRWEFYRRREDLRQFFDRWADDEHNANVRANEGKRPSDPGFVASGKGTEKTGLELFDYAGVPNPRIGNQPKGAIMPFKKMFYRMRYYDPAKRQASNARELGIIEVVKKKIYHLSLDEHEYAVKFDLNEPLNEQIEDVTRVLKRKQIELHGSAVQRRRHTKKWLGYLRTLDAHEAGASLAEIASLHPNTAQKEQTARDILDQARALCFNF